MSWWVLFAALAVLAFYGILKRRRAGKIAEQEKRTPPGVGRRHPVIRLPGDKSPAAVEAPRSGPVTATPVIEEVSVVLRRQVPVRWDAPARSWIGGLPMMPEDVEWPVGPTTDYPERGQTPLHFVAQIACADLPPELWGGLGPRTGWLLLFLNGQDWDVMDNSKAIRVLHIPELGPERTPPPGIMPVHDEMYTGPNYGFVRSQEDIPATWRRWPVDLVPIPNRAIEGSRVPSVIPENFASVLYGGAPEKDGRARPPFIAPFTWRGALYVVDSIIRVLAKEHGLSLDNVRGKVTVPGWVADAITRVDPEIARLQDSPVLRGTADSAADEAARARLEEARANIARHLEGLREARRFLVDSGDEPTLLARIEQSHQAHVEWRADAKQRVPALREAIIAHELDSALPEQDWEALRKALEEDRRPYWLLQSSGTRGLLPALIDQSLLDLAGDGVRAAQVELAADYYVSPELRHLVPAELVAFMEPHWRSLYSNRPHRMGGLHDGIQSDAEEGPTSSVLLFQIATDDAMHWVWGDAGAYYVFIDTDRLAAGDFSKLRAEFENH